MRQIRNLHNPLALAVIIVLVGVDQLTKLFAAGHLKENDPIALIPNVFELRYLENQSAAFGIDPITVFQRIFHISYFSDHPEAFLKCKMIFFVILTLIAVAVIIWIYWKLPAERHFLAFRAALILFLAGAIGNFVDRIWHNYVIDFFYFIPIDFPIFNVADIYVTTAAFLFILLGIFYYKEEDFERIFQSRFSADS